MQEFEDATPEQIQEWINSQTDQELTAWVADTTTLPLEEAAVAAAALKAQCVREGVSFDTLRETLNNAVTSRNEKALDARGALQRLSMGDSPQDEVVVREMPMYQLESPAGTLVFAHTLRLRISRHKGLFSVTLSDDAGPIHVEDGFVVDVAPRPAGAAPLKMQASGATDWRVAQAEVATKVHDAYIMGDEAVCRVVAQVI